MKPRPDMLDDNSPNGIEVIQITAEEVPSCHIYMEAQIFTPDSRMFILHRSATPHGPDKNDPEHRYLLCDIENGCALTPLTDEIGATAPSVSPDGKVLYYLVDEAEPGGGRVTFKKVNFDGTGRETITVIDSAIPPANYCPSRIYPLSTISSDGRRLAAAAFMGDSYSKGKPFGLIVFDLDNGSAKVVLEGPTWCNLHPQYCRSMDAEFSHDIMVQENHESVIGPDGEIVDLTGGTGADIHLIRDDGTNFRNLPWGRDGNEFCQGHQCWRGRTSWAITSTETRDVDQYRLIESKAVAHAGHVGLKSPGGLRNDLSRGFDGPNFYHFATDIAGRRLITDSGPCYFGEALYLASLGEPGIDALVDWTYLLRTGTDENKGTHTHPFLSPDGTTGFFNSDESGILQAFMIRGLENI